MLRDHAVEQGLLVGCQRAGVAHDGVVGEFVHPVQGDVDHCVQFRLGDAKGFEVAADARIGAGHKVIVRGPNLSQLATAASDRAVFAMRRWLQHPPSEARNKGAMSNLWLSANPHELMITVTRRRSGVSSRRTSCVVVSLWNGCVEVARSPHSCCGYADGRARR